MKDYKRLTDSETAKMLKNTEGESWDSDNIEAQIYIRLADLEDKIESGELCDRKEVAREIFDHIREYAIKDNCIIWRVYFSDLEEIAKQFGVEDEE